MNRAVQLSQRVRVTRLNSASSVTSWRGVSFCITTRLGVQALLNGDRYLSSDDLRTVGGFGLRGNACASHVLKKLPRVL